MPVKNDPPPSDVARVEWSKGPVANFVGKDGRPWQFDDIQQAFNEVDARRKIDQASTSSPMSTRGDGEHVFVVQQADSGKWEVYEYSERRSFHSIDYDEVTLQNHGRDSYFVDHEGRRVKVPGSAQAVALEEATKLERGDHFATHEVRSATVVMAARPSPSAPVPPPPKRR